MKAGHKNNGPILIVAGTRPEIIKTAPIYFELKRKRYSATFCFTGQHQSMATQALEFFNIKPDFTFNVMEPEQPLH
ncbi:MAG: UDP-N-acetylglucosamine 2-epimerase (non-hydrolyzing), partial [Candidatus Hydrogenedentota bacterium]